MLSLISRSSNTVGGYLTTEWDLTNSYLQIAPLNLLKIYLFTQNIQSDLPLLKNATLSESLHKMIKYLFSNSAQFQLSLFVFQYFDLVLPILMPLIVVSYPDRITEVKTNIYVTSFGPVSDTDMVRGDIGHVFRVFNYSPTSSHWRSTPLQKMTALYSLFIPTLRTERCFFCFIFSFIAAFPPFIIASSSLSLSPHTAQLWSGTSFPHDSTMSIHLTTFIL